MAHGRTERNTITYDAAVSSLREWAANWLHTVEALGRDLALVVWSATPPLTTQRFSLRVSYRLWKLLAEMALGRMERNTIVYTAAVSALRDRRALATSGGALGRDGTLSSGTEHHHVQCSILLREKASHVMTKYSNNIIVLSNCIITSLHCFYVVRSVW